MHHHNSPSVLRLTNPFLPSVLFIFLFLVGYSALAQKSTEDVLYLKNGWVLRGTLTSSPTDSLIIIETHDRNRFVFRRPEVDALRQEPVQAEKNFNTRYKRRGFSHYTELGALAARNTSSSTNTSAFSFQTINGYKFGQAFFSGLGIGIDLYATQSLMPLFGSIRGDITDRGNLIPYYFADVGYGANITGKDTNPFPRVIYQGGSLFAVGAGMKVIFNNSTGFLLSVGYRSQRTSIARDFGNNSTSKEGVNFNRVAVRAGFTF
jgi:hypothetical protein